MDMESPNQSVVCEEIFDDTSHPSEDEIRDYATKIGIDPQQEPHFLPLAAEGLMKPLPPGWKPLFNEKKKAYYYHNTITGKTQWEHPLDDLYRGLVVKARKDSQSLSLGDPGEDATYTRDDLPSYEEPPLPLTSSTYPRKLAPLIRTKLNQTETSDDMKIKSRPIVAIRRSSLNLFSSEEKKLMPRPASGHNEDPPVLTGGGSMFLKSNTQKLKGSKESLVEEAKDFGQPLRSILRENPRNESIEKSEEDDKKSVRFNNETNPDETFFFSEESDTDDPKKTEQIVVVEATKPRSRFTVSPAFLPKDLKVVKPNPTDFLKLDKTCDSDEESASKPNHKDAVVESDSDSFITKREIIDGQKLNSFVHLEEDADANAYKKTLFQKQKEELEKILVGEKCLHEEKIKNELEKLRSEMENRLKGTLCEEKLRFDEQLKEQKVELTKHFDQEENQFKCTLQKKFEAKKRDLEKINEEKLLLIEKEMGEKLQKAKDELIVSHNAILHQIKQNHSRVLDELQKDYKAEEEIIRKEHQRLISELKGKAARELEERSRSMGNEEEKLYEKVRCEKRLLEDKYRCLKDKYLKLKTEVKLSIEKRNRKKEQSLTTTTTTTTGSETEKSPTTKHDRAQQSPTGMRRPSPKHRVRARLPHDMDTSVSDRSCHLDEARRDCDSSDAGAADATPSRGRRKLFTRLRYGGARSKDTPPTRCCSPVENLRKQLQKLEDLEDQLPQQSQADTYHLRYPFSDAHKFEGSSELEFFRHRIHLERDSIRMAKESLKSQRSHFKQRQNELKLKHGHFARHTLEQLCQEEKELTDMEVSLHRTRSLLGEKVIRLRHLEQSLQRATANTDHQKQHEEATLSDLSSHSASSGISSTEFADSPRARGAHLKQSSEIIQSLENLNSEIREIWEVLHKQQQNSNISAMLPPLPLIYSDLSWPMVVGNGGPVPPSIPTLADRLQNYRQHVALANAQRTIVTHDTQGATTTTTLVEKTRNLRQWLRQTATDAPAAEGGSAPQTTL